MFDYIVVGAGAAGCVLASRLSEDPHAKVLLLEAGPPDDAIEIRVPAFAATLYKTEFDWDLVSEPEAGFGGRRTYLPRGKTLGGSTALNGGIYIRGNRSDYDTWAAAGFDGWSYAEVLPYFKRSENNARGESEYHGVGGELHVQDVPAPTPGISAWVEAAEQAGLPVAEDYNGPRQEGVGLPQRTVHRGLRWSSADAFLKPVLDRPNLTVVTRAHASRVLFEGTRAIGVEYIRGDGEVVQEHAGEIVLSGGAYGSAQLLLLSGIGPADQLEFHQIPVVADLPVGEELQDHCVVLVTHATTDSLRSRYTPENIGKVLTEGTGPMTSNLCDGCGYVRTRDDLAGPDLWMLCGPGLYADEGLTLPTVDALSQGVSLQGATSRGRITLRSARPLAKPRIWHNYLATDEDRQSMRAGVRILMDIARQPALRDLIIGPLTAPASDSDSDIDEFLRRNAQTSYHPAGSVGMGRVVDAELRVFGIEGLRVADASVMPTLVRGNTMTPTIMIAEKAADLIRGRTPLARAQVGELVS